MILCPMTLKRRLKAHTAHLNLLMNKRLFISTGSALEVAMLSAVCNDGFKASVVCVHCILSILSVVSELMQYDGL